MTTDEAIEIMREEADIRDGKGLAPIFIKIADLLQQQQSQIIAMLPYMPCDTCTSPGAMAPDSRCIGCDNKSKWEGEEVKL